MEKRFLPHDLRWIARQERREGDGRMIRQNQEKLSRLNAISDGALVLLSYLFAAWFWVDVVKGDPNMASLRNLGNGMGLAAVAYTVWTVLLFACFGLYRASRMRRFYAEVRLVAVASAISLVTAAAALYFFRLQEFSRGVLGLFYIFSCGSLSFKRACLRLWLRRVRAKGYNIRHILVVGGGDLAGRYVRAVTEDRRLGIQVDGQFPGDHAVTGILEEHLHGEGIDEVVIALEPTEVGCTADVIRVCEKCGTKISIVPFYNDVMPAHPTIDEIGPIKLIQLRVTPLDEPINALIKRGFDLVASVLLLIIGSPLLLAIALSIKLTSPGPVLFCQERVGLNKKIFKMYKFRSMRVNDEENTAWSGAVDDRRTRVGALLRKTSLDELPQLFNVLRGEMSLVGPRPEIPYYVEQFRETVPLYMVKYQVRPGMTGWAQVNGLRGDTSIPQRVEHDLWYIDHWSLSLDLYILFRTAFGGMLNDEKLGRAKKETGKGEKQASGEGKG